MNSRYKAGFWVLCFGLWVYIILRAIYSPFVFDEATTFLLYVHNNKIIPGHAFWSANNHILNTALTWISYNLLGPEEWQLRLPNVLAFPVFCFFLYKISLKLKGFYSRFILVAGVLSGHIFLEMFGFSRGYGLSFAALSGAIYFGLNTLNEDSLKSRIGLYLCNLLMLLANLTLLPISLTITAVSVFYTRKNGRSKSQLLGNVFFLGLPIALSAFLSFQLKTKGELYYAADSGFWSGTIKSLLTAFWYGDGYFEQSIFIAILVFVALLFWQNIKNKTVNRNAVFVALIFATPFVFYPLAKVLIAVEYPLDRAVLYVPFLLFLALAFVLEYSNVSRSIKTLVSVVAIVPLFISFVSHAGLKKATGFKWNTEQIPDAFFNEVLQNNATVGGYFLRQKCWEYLNIKSDDKANVLQILDFPGNTADYQIVNTYDLKLFSKNYEIVLEGLESDLLLLKRKSLLHRENLIAKSELINLKNKQGFTVLQEFKVDSAKPLQINFNGNLKSQAHPFNGLLAISVLDEKGIQLLYEEIRLRNLNLNFNEPQNISQTMYYPNKSGGKTLNIMFWNKDDQDFEWINLESSVYSLKLQE